jgi:CBS domain-containing protein
MALTVRDIMDADPVTVSPADDVETVVRILRNHELPGVPVVNEGGRCVGIVTEAGRLIVRRGHNRLPVVEHGRLVGVVTRVDVLEALTRDEA